MRERKCVEKEDLFERNVRMVSTKSRFMSEGFCFGVKSPDSTLNELRAWRTEGCVLREQLAYARQEFRA